jgi:hypothetical protein
MDFLGDTRMKTLIKKKLENLRKKHGYLSVSMLTDLERRYIENMPENIKVRELKRPCGK